MRKTNSLKLIPDNPKKFDGFASSSLGSGFMTLDEKVKKDPLNREKFRCEAKVSTGYSPNRRHRRGHEPQIQQASPSSHESQPASQPIQQYAPPVNSPYMNQGNATLEMITHMMPNMLRQGVEKYDIRKQIQIPNFPDGPKEYIKNMTPIEIILDFNSNQNIEGADQVKRPNSRPKTIKLFLGKWEVRGYENHYVLEGLYKTGHVMDITKEQFDYEMEIIKVIDHAEEIELADRTKEAERTRMDHQHSGNGGLRKIGSGGVEMVIPDGPIGGMSSGVSDYPAQSQTADGGTIHFDAGGSGAGTVNPRTEGSEHDALVNSIIMSQPPPK